MKLNNINNNSYILTKTAKQSGGRIGSSNCAQNLSFQGDLVQILGKTKKINNIDKIMSTLDGVLGEKDYLANAIQKAGLTIEDNSLILKNHKNIFNICSSAARSVTDLPGNIISACVNGLKNGKHTGNFGNKLANNRFIQNVMDKAETRKSYELVDNLIYQFFKENLDDVDKLGKMFSEKTAEKIVNISKGYKTRDERTLNRFITGSVGAILSGVDMHNISMLEKNDKSSANKAQKDRTEQEMQRIRLSSALTFLSLGALSKCTGDSVVLNSLVIAFSTLIAEVIPRLRKHKPLVPLTPKQAEEFAKKNKSIDFEPSFNSVRLTMNRINQSDKSNLYKNFTQTKNTYTQEETKKEENTPKKGNRILKAIGAAFAFASLSYAAVRYGKGDYSKLHAARKLYMTDKANINAFIKGRTDKLDEALVSQLKEINDKKGRFDLPKFFEDKIRDKIIKRNILIDTNKINQELDRLANEESAENILPIIEKYKEHLAVVKNKKSEKYFQKDDIPIIGAVYAGVTKMFKTLYEIFSLPARIISSAIYGKSEKLLQRTDRLYNYADSPETLKVYKKEINELHKLFKKRRNKDINYEKIAKDIEKRTRNFEIGAETGDLANLARILVTFISSYFYVNDFRNTVLIESKGKNTQRAREVMNDSIGFKICNLFFNGSIMNLGNSIFKSNLNSSLFGASLVAAGEEIANEFLIRKTISRPMKKMDSRDEIIEFERSQANKEGFAGWWTRNFKKLTGQKSLVEKYEAQKSKK